MSVQSGTAQAVFSAEPGLGFDPAALRAKYRTERDKRLRSDGNDQYVEVKGDFSRYVDDPYIEQAIVREPITEETEVLLIGGGFGGLVTGARLREAGVEDLRILEKGGDFGGTWYWNRYPGACCDTESYIYLPLLEELGFMPEQKYTHAPEILAHSRRIGERYRLYEGALFQTTVTEAAWDESLCRWIVKTDRGDAIRARFVVMSNGPLNRPKLPGIKGIDSFQGHTFHTSRWDYNYTGGGPEGNLTGLQGKRVGVIGTGATAVQCVPHLGEAAQELYVFQRTPSSIDVRANRPTDPEWFRAQKPGWQKRRMENFHTLVSGGMAEEDLVNDGWTEIVRNLWVKDSAVRGDADQDQPVDPEAAAQAMELADFQKMEQIRARAAELVKDSATAEALKPWYRQFCKRPCFHDDYLQTFNRPNVHLVDTDGKGVERITPKGLVANGKEYELDCLIFATGFEFSTDYTRRSGYDLIGKGGQRLSDKWQDGARTLHGLHTNGFPNLFIMSLVQSGFAANYPHLIEEQAQQIAYILSQVRNSNVTTVEASTEAEDAWVQNVITHAGMNRDFLEACTPGYYNGEGRLDPKAAQNGFYFGAGDKAFFNVLADWRKEGSMQGLELA